MAHQRRPDRNLDFPLVAAAATARRPTRWGWAIVISFVIYWGVGYAAYKVGQPHGGDDDHGYAPFVWAGVGFGLTAIVLALWVRLKEGRPISTLGFPRGGLGRFLVGVVLGTGLCLGLVGVAMLAGQVERVDAPSASEVGAAAVVPALLMFLVFVVQGPAEEIVYRGYVLPVLGTRLPLWVAVVVSSGLWMFNHVGDPGFDPVVLLNLMIWGVFLCLLCLRDGSLWLVCGVHAAWNWTEANLIGFDTAGMTSPASLIFVSPTKDVNLTILNVDYGLEGGFLATGYFTVMLVGAWGYFRSGR